MSDKPTVSIIVCTRNRAALLGRVLRELRALQAPAGLSWELIVVDNASSDNTAQVVRDHAGPGRSRYVQEPRLGIAPARNRGLAEAAGEYVAYLDDDGVVHKDWLVNLERCLEETDADAVGGRIYLDLQAAPPAWFGPGFRVALGELDHGPDRAVLGPGQAFGTANMVLKRSVLPPDARFDEELGRRGGELGGYEDALLIGDMIAAGRKVVYEPGMRVGHIIGPDRMTWAYFKRLARGTGRSFARLAMDGFVVTGLQRLLRVMFGERRLKGSRLGAALLKPRRPFTRLPRRPSVAHRLGRIVLACAYVLFCLVRVVGVHVALRGPYQRRIQRYSLLMGWHMLCGQLQ